MGMFDRVKEAQAKAKEALATVGGGGLSGGMPAGMPSGMPAGMPNMDEQLRYRELAQKLKASGVEAPAVITALRRGEADPISGSIKAEVDLTIKPPNGEPYPATVKQSMLPAWLDTLSDGDAVTVKFDPDSPTSALIYGGI
jgi:hypothetical protein